MPLIFVLMFLCGCSGTQENTDTRLLLDTFVTLTADCGGETISAAFEECARYEHIFSRTDEESEVSRLNRSGEEFINVSECTRTVIERGIWYGELTAGRFDITMCPVSELWNFENQQIPGRDEISEALKNVDYQGIEVTDKGICLHGKKLDLGGIAKGYIADCLVEYLRDNGAENGIVNLGGDLRVFGNKEQIVRVQAPDGGYAAAVSVKNRAVVTSGTYERNFINDGVNYHHILDPSTGCGAATDIAGATVICKSAMDGDALATSCILLGSECAAELIEGLADTEAIFINNSGDVWYTSGIEEKNGILYIK